MLKRKAPKARKRASDVMAPGFIDVIFTILQQILRLTKDHADYW